MRNTPHKNGQVDWIEQNFSKVPEKPKGWVTVTDIMNQTGNSRKLVEYRIKEMLASGLLESMDCMDNKRRAKCFRQKVSK